MISKQELHDVLQEHARSQPGIPPLAVLARWVVVRELVMPDGERVLNRATGDLGNETLTAWDIRGFLTQILETLPPMQPLGGPDPPDDSPSDPDHHDDIPF